MSITALHRRHRLVAGCLASAGFAEAKIFRDTSLIHDTSLLK
jgi:hypothetical protein